MKLWTAGEILTKVKNDLDLISDPMITDQELYGNMNAAINEVEKFLPEDYMLQSANLALVSGQSIYDYPANIFAQKIRHVFYDSGAGSLGSERYEVKRIRDLKRLPYVQPFDLYRYIPITQADGTQKLKIFPPSRETSASNVTIWFKGVANTLSTSTDIMNIPEAADYVIEKTKLLCARKEGHPAQMALEQEVERQRQMMIEALTPMIEDEDNRVILDNSDFDCEGYF